MLHFFDGICEKLLRKSEKPIYVVTPNRVFLTENQQSLHCPEGTNAL